MIHVVGNCTVDLVFRLDAFPRPGETVIARERLVDVGGKGANQAVVAARFGLPVRLIAPLGRDAEGALARSRLLGEGLPGEALLWADAPTDQSIISVVPGGENTIVSSAAAADSLGAADVAAALAGLTAADAVLVQGNLSLSATRAALAAGDAAGALTLLNPAPVRWPADELWPLARIAVLNRIEAELLLGTAEPEAAVARLAERGVGTAIVTLGAGGLAVRDGGRTWRVPAVPVQAVDTAGAGDAFCGALVSSLVAGLDLDRALALAAEAAAVTVARPGTQRAFPQRDEAAALLAAARRAA